MESTTTEEIEKRYIKTTSGQIHLRLTGNHTLPPLLLLHQTASSSAMYEALMGHLAKTFWLIAPDMAGFGQSDPPPQPKPTISFHAAVFWELLDQLQLNRCFIFGHHTGASVAVQMAFDQPQRVNKLALSGPPLLTKVQIEKLQQGLLPIALDPDGRFLLDTWQRLSKKEPQASLDLILRETLLTIQAGEHYPAAYHAVFGHDMAGQLAVLRCPTLLMAGEQDSLYSCLDTAAACLPAALPQEIHHIPRAGSYICDLQPELVARKLLDFFSTKH